MKSAKSTFGSGSLVLSVLCGLLTVVLGGAQSARAALPDYIFFSVNGDTTASTMTQGDEFFWGSNCDIGATINWQIWFDTDSNSIIAPGTDILLNSENITDGDLNTEEDAILDGWSISWPFSLSAQPGDYIFRAIDVETGLTVQKVLTMNAMPVIPNQLTGQIVLPGISAPDARLADNVVFAESETGVGGVSIAFTDNTGFYSMNVAAEGTGVQFYVMPREVTGFVSPEPSPAIAVGVVPGIDFVFTAATDSVWGFVKDQSGDILPYESDVEAWSWDGQSSGRRATTLNGRYAIYFADTDGGTWALETSSSHSPVFLAPGSFEFSLDTVTSFQRDLVLLTTNAEVYARITENGGLPTGNYLLNAYSGSLDVWGEAVSGTGADNVATLPISSLDNSGWEVGISTWDDELPIPPGLILSPVSVGNVAPGDTVDLALVSGTLVSGTITQDPGDAPIDWNQVSVGAGAYNTTANGAGTYYLYTDVGLYYLGVYADGYITNPDHRFLNVTGDTTVGLDYTINQAHCRVSGTLMNVPLPLDGSHYLVQARSGSDPTDGYYVWAEVDSATGAYSMDLCDGDWRIIPPCCFPDVNDADSAVFTVAESPSDLTKTIDFVYGAGCCAMRGDLDHSGVTNIADLTYLVAKLFQGGPDPICLEEGDVEGNGTINIADLTYLVAVLFQGGDDPPPCS